MSVKNSISRVSVLDKGRDLSASIMRPTAPVKTQIETLELENPDPAMLGELRTAGWKIEFQTFNVVWTPNGMKGHRFLYLERERPASMGQYHQ